MPQRPTARRRARLSAPTLHHAAVPLVRQRAGATFHDGAVLRVFAPRRTSGYPPRVVAAMVREGMALAHELGDPVRLVVMPAGVGRVADVSVASERWTDAGRLAARDAIVAWTARFVEALPRPHPPIVLGLDGAVRFTSWGYAPGAIQVAATVVESELVGVCWKSKPRDAWERRVIEIAWDATRDRPTADALRRHEPVATIHGRPVLACLCHDAVFAAPRSRAASQAGGWASTVYAQYERLLREPGAPRAMVNLIHVLPRSATSHRATSPSFQSAHIALRTRFGMAVIAVAGTNRDCSVRAFDALHAKLACDYRGVDILFRPRPPARAGRRRG